MTAISKKISAEPYANAHFGRLNPTGGVLPAAFTAPPAAGPKPGDHYHVGRYDAAASLIEMHHYSRRTPANVQFVATMHESGGLFGDYGEAVAACVFSIPPTRWSEPVLELSRLVRSEATVKLTGLIGFSCRELRRRGYDLLVSFADITQGHHGGIYQAASWCYGGARERRMDGVVINGSFIPGRSCNSRWGTRSPRKLNEKLNMEVVPHYDAGKHIYWRGLGARGKKKAAKLGLASLPYPKPDGATCAG